MTRLRPYCVDCRSHVRGTFLDHLSTRRHRRSTAPRSSGKYRLRGPRPAWTYSAGSAWDPEPDEAFL